MGEMYTKKINFIFSKSQKNSNQFNSVNLHKMFYFLTTRVDILIRIKICTIILTLISHSDCYLTGHLHEWMTHFLLNRGQLLAVTIVLQFSVMHLSFYCLGIVPSTLGYTQVKNFKRSWDFSPAI